MLKTVYTVYTNTSGGTAGGRSAYTHVLYFWAGGKRREKRKKGGKGKKKREKRKKETEEKGINEFPDYCASNLSLIGF